MEEQQVRGLKNLGRRVTLRRLGISGEWVGIALSVVLAVDARSAATRDPAIDALLPALVRVAQGREDSPYGFAWLYVQPTFYSTTTNDRVEVVADMRLEVRRLDARGSRAAPQAFRWDQVAAFSFDPAINRFNYHYVSDPEPLLVGADNAESPLGVFNGPNGWYFEAGTYETRS